MENYRFTLPLLPTPGKLTTVYAVDGGAARNAVLTTMATLLADRARAGVPVLMIDWDTEAPGLHDECGGAARASRPGLLEYFAACRDQLDLLRQQGEGGGGGRVPERKAERGGRTDPAGESAAELELRRARQVFEAVDWEPFIERVDDHRPLYLMRAGCCDDSFGERAAAADWEGLFAASPSLFRCFAEHLVRRFAHVLVASRGGRSAAVSVCTSLLPDQLVMLFSPNRRSLDGACGVVRRAIDYRSSHEEAQRPLLVYPLPIELDGADLGRRLRWRHGDPGSESGGYQCVLEQLMRDSYGLSALSLDSYLDHVQLQQFNAMAEALPPRLPLTADRFSLARGVSELLEWAADGAFPWQEREELALARGIAGARATDPDAQSPAAQARLAEHLLALGRVQQRAGRCRQALASVSEAAAVQTALWGADHPATRAARAGLAAQLRQCGTFDAALAQYRSLYEDTVAELGHAHPDTLAVRAGLAAALADCGRFDSALGHAEQVVMGWRELYGLNHRQTLAAQSAHAGLLARAGDLGRARMLHEQVLEGRERVLGRAHADTLDSMAQLAAVLAEMGHLDSARCLQEQLADSRRRLLGADHTDTIAAGLALAETLAAQCDLGRVGQLCGPLAAACERRFGSHPPLRSEALQMASALAQQAGLMAAASAQPAAAVHAQAQPQPPCQAAHAPAAPHESGFTPPATYGAAGGHDQGGECTVDACEIERGVIRLEQMEDRAADEARELADRLREPVMLADLAPMVRARGVRAIVDVYFSQGDTDAMIAFMQEQRPMPIR